MRPSGASNLDTKGITRNGGPLGLIEQGEARCGGVGKNAT